MSDQKLEQIRLETEQDDELRLIMNHTKLGWLNYINSIPQKAKTQEVNFRNLEDFCYSETE